MDRELLEINLTTFYEEVREVIKEIKEVSGNNIYRVEFMERIKVLSSKWFKEFSNVLPVFNIPNEIIEKYNSAFSEILSLSLKVSRKNTYLRHFEIIIRNWGEELLIPILKYSAPISSITLLPNILQNVTEREREYLEEAIGCAEREYYRASVVLGWCAAVHRMQKVVERLGFNEFNKKSEEMKNITQGRYKRFTKKYYIQNFNDLQATVFDNDLLWVLEYWGLIDTNQSGRLFRCFEMRNNSSHPGQAEISPENLASFYSDLKTIIFDNPNFLL